MMLSWMQLLYESTCACLLAVATKKSGAWLDALPVSSLSLRMDDNVIQIAVGLCVGLPLYEPHHCQQCGTEVDSMGTHGLNCCYSRGRHPHHAEINGIIQRSFRSAKIPCHLEHTGLYRPDGKKSNGASIVPWRADKVQVWDVTCLDTLAPSYSAIAAREAEAVASKAKRRRRAKYTHVNPSTTLCP